MNRSRLGRLFSTLLLAGGALCAADPTFMVRRVRSIQPQPDDLTAGATSVSYRPIFGAGDKDAAQLKSIARYGELTVRPGGSTAVVGYPREEQVYYVLEGRGTLVYADEKVPIRRHDYVFFPPGVRHGISNPSEAPLTAVVMGFRIPQGWPSSPVTELKMANSDDVPLQEMPSHGKTALFRMLLGPHNLQVRGGRIPDRLLVSQVIQGMYIIEFAPGGTNVPHHHVMEEEIYYLLRGRGDMVAGGGVDGNEGRHPAAQGDVYFFRLNATVGFYGGNKEGEPHSAILAVRSRYPFPFAEKR